MNYFTLILITALLFIGCTSGISNENEINSRGNTTGNIVNFGFVAQEGDWLFYNVSKDEEYSLWKKNINTKKRA